MHEYNKEEGFAMPWSHGENLPDEVDIAVVTILHPRDFLPGFNNLRPCVFKRQARNVWHEKDGKLLGTTRREITEKEKELKHAGVSFRMEVRADGTVLARLIKTHHMKAQAVLIENPGKNPDRKIELRPFPEEERLNQPGWLDPGQIAELRERLNQPVRIGWIWVNPARDEKTGEVIWLANIIVGPYDPARCPQHSGMPEFTLPLASYGTRLDLNRLVAWFEQNKSNSV